MHRDCKLSNSGIVSRLKPLKTTSCPHTFAHSELPTSSSVTRSLTVDVNYKSDFPTSRELMLKRSPHRSLVSCEQFFPMHSPQRATFHGSARLGGWSLLEFNPIQSARSSQGALLTRSPGRRAYRRLQNAAYRVRIEALFRIGYFLRSLMPALILL